MASSSSIHQSVFEGFEFGEASNVLLMALMEETQEEQNCEDERLVSMIQSLEAEISRNSMLMEQVDGKDCSTSSISTDDYYDDIMDIDQQVVPSISPFDDLNAWSPCADMNQNHYFDQFYYFDAEL
ncbi:uncharacterized protein LOC129312534 [Prosopis cineraria]|uniref:uncharacterized protein LOC129312534 n=1 Tax=Prosopis cineraria TaxID=364024 RepID=UPI00240FF5FE|nr:uncharacterized protein LOC129312534 [Prosopis cineraria]